MKRCDVCIHWIPRTDIGYCEKKGTEDIEANDSCDLHKAENEQKNDKKQHPQRNS